MTAKKYQDQVNKKVKNNNINNNKMTKSNSKVQRLSVSTSKGTIGKSL